MSDDDRLPGEEAIIQGYLRPLAETWPGAYDLLDDCAAVRPAPGHELIAKTDPIRAGVHFYADDDPADIAWKALAVNVSDLAAKAARPLAYMLALSFPEAPAKAWLSEFARGLRAAQDAFACALIGGDTDRAAGPLSIAVTVLGEAPVGKMIRRVTPAVGDLVFVSGTLGDAALGLAVRSGTPPEGLDDAARRSVLNRYLRPQPRLGLRAALRADASAAMDLSDGLVKDLGRMCRGASLGARIQLLDIPLSAAVEAATASDLTARKRLISAGDDYEILCAVPPQRADHFVALAAAAGERVTPIGAFTRDNAPVLIDESGRNVDWAGAGYDHF